MKTRRHRSLDEDEARKPKLGRVDEREARVWEDMMRFRPFWRRSTAPRLLPRRVSQTYWDHELVRESKFARVNVVTRRREIGWRKEAVIKIASRAHTAQQARRTLTYISRSNLEGSDEAAGRTIYDEYNEAITLDDAKTTVATWREFEIAQPDELGRRPVVSWHLIMSVEEDLDADVERKLQLAVAATIDEVFAANSFSLFWTIHNDTPSHPHAHLLIRAVAADGSRIHFDKHGDFIFALRTRFARYLSAAGLSYDATRREDRVALQTAIMAGEEPLRRNKSLPQVKLGETSIKRLAPVWWQTHGKAAYARASKKPERIEPANSSDRWSLKNLISGLAKQGSKSEDEERGAKSRSDDELQDIIDEQKWLYREQRDAITKANGASDQLVERFDDGTEEGNKLASWYIENVIPQLVAIDSAHIESACFLDFLDEATANRKQAKGLLERPHEQKSAVDPKDVNWNRHGVIRSLRRLHRWYKDKPHYPEQLAELERCIWLAERVKPSSKKRGSDNRVKSGTLRRKTSETPGTVSSRHPYPLNPKSEKVIRTGAETRNGGNRRRERRRPRGNER